MSIYKINSEQIYAAFHVDGQEALAAYDIDGVKVFQKDGIPIKVMQYNCGGWYIGSGTNVPAAEDADYYALQNGMISSINADILCIEEYWATFSKSGRTAESLLSQYYPYIESAGDGTTWFGRAICSKYPIIDYVTNYYSVDSSRYFDVAEIDVEGSTVYVFVTHLSTTNSSWKAQQATELLNYIKDNNKYPFIICGDFNSTLRDPMTEYNIAVYKQYLDDGCTIANDGEFGIFPTYCETTDWAADAYGIDNIIISDAFTFTSVATDLTKTTDEIVAKIDHVPLYADIVLRTGGEA